MAARCCTQRRCGRWQSCRAWVSSLQALVMEVDMQVAFVMSITAPLPRLLHAAVDACHRNLILLGCCCRCTADNYEGRAAIHAVVLDMLCRARAVLWCR